MMLTELSARGHGPPHSVWPHQSSPGPHEVSPANTPISQGRKLRQGRVEKLVQGISVSKGLQDFDPGVCLDQSRLSEEGVLPTGGTGQSGAEEGGSGARPSQLQRWPDLL